MSTKSSLLNSLIISNQTQVIKLTESSTLTQVIKLIDLKSSTQSQVLISEIKVKLIARYKLRVFINKLLIVSHKT